MVVNRTRGWLIGVALSSILTIAVSETRSEPIRVAAIGDSITQAAVGRGSDGGYSYRYWLWRQLIDAGAEIDMVGSTNVAFDNGDAGWPDHNGQTFDRDHEGHWGQSTAFVRNNLPTWLNGYDVDVALIHIGHNDGWRGITIDDTRSNMVQLIQLLQQDNPSIKVLLAKVIPVDPSRAGSAFPLSHINAVNGIIDEVAATTTTATSSVHVVDLNSNFDANTMLYDGVHPNALGEAFMANGWFQAFQTHVPEPGSFVMMGLGWLCMTARRRAHPEVHGS